MSITGSDARGAKSTKKLTSFLEAREPLWYTARTMPDTFVYAAAPMSRKRRKAMLRTLALFLLTIGAGLGADRLPAYRDAIARFEMGRAFLFTLPAIALALVTYVSGWDMRRHQSESQARYRLTGDALVRECRGEEPERIPWIRIDHITDGALVTLSGARLPFYPELLEDGVYLLARMHREAADRQAAAGRAPDTSPTFAPADLAEGPGRTPPRWPARLPEPAPDAHALRAGFYETAIRAKENAAAGR